MRYAGPGLTKDGFDVDVFVEHDPRIVARVRAISGGGLALVYDEQTNPEVFDWWMDRVDFFHSIVYASKIEVRFDPEAGHVNVAFIDQGQWVEA